MRVLNKMTLQNFCNFMFGNQEIAEAHVVITDACHWVNKSSPVRHEFLVVYAKMAGYTFWVRIDRSRTGKGKATMQWDALDTVSEFWGVYKYTH